MYRIIGVDVTANVVYLEGNYIAPTNAAAQFRVFQYEFALPPDLDTLSQVYYDGNLTAPQEVGYCNNAEFNRMMSYSEHHRWSDARVHPRRHDAVQCHRSPA